MHDCLIAFGSNLGDANLFLDSAVAALKQHSGIEEITRVSSLIQTKPIGGPKDSPVYSNAAIRVSFNGQPKQLLGHLLKVENELGRVRKIRWDSRTIDLDLLLHGNLIIESDDLILPHPRMSYRRFVLQPAVEIADEMLHPVSRCQLKDLLSILDTRPDRVLIVSSNDMRPVVLKLTCELGRRFPNWQISSLDHHREFYRQSRTTKLVAMVRPKTICSPVEKEFLAQVLRFKGPTVVLDQSVGFEQNLKELEAAIEAMKRF
ncbi:MAG: 2-amino-4-hydroxy-6-hydroxymethyldihydropteridine diphosphokinase [Planctomycetota bacterium]